MSGLLENWTTARLDEIAAINPGWDSQPNDDAVISFVPMAAAEAGTGRFDPSGLRTVQEVKAGFTRFQDGDVLFAKITPSMENGKMVISRNLRGGIGAGTTEFHVVRPVAGVLPEFILYFVLQEGFRREARRHMKGVAGQLRVPAEFLAEAILPLAPLSEQRRIVAAIEEHFTRLDAAVAALQRVRANLKRYRASLLKAACEGRLVPTEAELARAEGREYEPARELLKRIAGSATPEQPSAAGLEVLPEGWCWTSLDRLLLILRNGLAMPPKESSGIRILRISAVRSMSVDMSDVRYLPDTPRAREFAVCAGDLLFTRYNGTPSLVGVCGIVPEYPEMTLHPDKLIRGIVRQGVVPQFLAIVSNAGISRAHIERCIKTTAGQSGIAGGDLRQTPIPLAPVAEQQRIVAEIERRLSVVDEVEASVEQQLQRAERLRQAILKGAFEGKLVPQDPNDEPALVLLERIRAERRAQPKAARPRRGRTGTQLPLVMT